jgi:hypothetical protein
MRDYSHPAVIEECRLASLCCDAHEALIAAERHANDTYDMSQVDPALAQWRQASAALQEHREKAMVWQQDTPAGPIYIPAS